MLSALHAALGSVLRYATLLLSRTFAWYCDTKMATAEATHIAEKRRELVSLIERGSSVLEIGAGTGLSISAGAYDGSEGRFSRVVLVEPDVGMRGRIQGKLDGSATGVARGALTVVDAALPRLPFQDAEFDAVVAFFVCSHLPNRADGLAEIVRVLKPGGKFVFIDHGVHDHGPNHGHAHKHTDDASDAGAAGAPGDDNTLRKRAIKTAATPMPWFWEWRRFLKYSHEDDDSSIKRLVDDFRKESRLEELFESRLQTNTFIGEITYGAFAKKGDSPAN